MQKGIKKMGSKGIKENIEGSWKKWRVKELKEYRRELKKWGAKE